MWPVDYFSRKLAMSKIKSYMQHGTVPEIIIQCYLMRYEFECSSFHYSLKCMDTFKKYREPQKSAAALHGFNWRGWMRGIGRDATLLKSSFLIGIMKSLSL